MTKWRRFLHKKDWQVLRMKIRHMQKEDFEISQLLFHCTNLSPSELSAGNSETNNKWRTKKIWCEVVRQLWKGCATLFPIINNRPIPTNQFTKSDIVKLHIHGCFPLQGLWPTDLFRPVGCRTGSKVKIHIHGYSMIFKVVEYSRIGLFVYSTAYIILS